MCHSDLLTGLLLLTCLFMSLFIIMMKKKTMMTTMMMAMIHYHIIFIITIVIDSSHICCVGNTHQLDNNGNVDDRATMTNTYRVITISLTSDRARNTVTTISVITHCPHIRTAEWSPFPTTSIALKGRVHGLTTA